MFKNVSFGMCHCHRENFVRLDQFDENDKTIKCKSTSRRMCIANSLKYNLVALLSSCLFSSLLATNCAQCGGVSVTKRRGSGISGACVTFFIRKRVIDHSLLQLEMSVNSMLSYATRAEK